MTTIATQFGIKAALAQLVIRELNDGTSTGVNSFSTG
jgi:aldehyde dehydrogenase (NAD+)